MTEKHKVKVENKGVNPFMLNDDEIIAMTGELTDHEMQAVKAVLNGVKKLMHSANPSDPHVHADGCWSWGPTHYLCAYNKIVEFGEVKPAMSMSQIASLAIDLKLEIDDVRRTVRAVEAHHNIGA